MKTSTVVAVLAPSVATAQWWHGAPECAHSCLSSAYAEASASATSGNKNAPYWPVQSDYCNSDKGNKISSCLNDGCKATPTAASSYVKMSSSLCAQWASCTAAGSTGVHTVTLPGGPVTWGAPGGWGTNGPAGSKNFGGGPGGFNNNNAGGQGGGWAGAESDDGNSGVWSEWASAYSGSKTWTGGVLTVTGCLGDGSPWFSGPGCGWNAQGGFNGWVGWGNGWKWGSTATNTVVVTTTTAAPGKNNNNDAGPVTTTFTGLATVAAAISGDFTTSTTLGVATSTSAANGAARIGGSPLGASEGSMVTGMMGIALGAVIVIAGML